MRNVPTSSAIHSQPNVTPMIDVMLVLLIIFMVVAPMLDQGFRATAPTGINLAKHLEEQGEAVIGIDERGRLYLNRAPVTEGALAERLAEHFRRHKDMRVAYLRADRNTDYAVVQATLATAGASGARMVGLISEAPFGAGAVVPAH